MTGGNRVATQLPGAAQQQVKFQIPVAVNAGDGRAAALVDPHKFVNYFLVKILGEVEDIKGNAQCIGHRPGVLHVVQAAAGVAAGNARRRVLKKPHGHPDARISLLLQKAGGHAGIHPAAHGDQNFSGHGQSALGLAFMAARVRSNRVSRSHPSSSAPLAMTSREQPAANFLFLNFFFRLLSSRSYTLLEGSMMAAAPIRPVSSSAA